MAIWLSLASEMEEKVNGATRQQECQGIKTSFDALLIVNDHTTLRARLVLGWVTAWESRVLLTFCQQSPNPARSFVPGGFN